MTRFLVRRLLSSVVGLFLLLTFVFFFAQLLMPGDFVSQLRLVLTGEQIAAVRHQLGLDLPMWERYLKWLGDVVTGHLGTSLSGTPVASLLVVPLVWSLLEFVVAMSIAFVMGSWWGRVVGWKPRRRWGRVLSFVAVGADTAFPPWLAFILAYGLVAVAGMGALVSARNLDRTIWTSGRWFVLLWMLGAVVVFFAASAVLSRLGSLQRRRGWSRVLVLVLPVAGPVAVWIQAGIWTKVADFLALLALPTIALVVLFYGEIMLIVESIIEDVRTEPFVTTARAKGIPERQVRDRHAGRIALLPAISRLAISLPYFLTGLVIIEYSFVNQSAGGLWVRTFGIGTLLFGSIQSQDIPVLMGVLLVIGLITLAMRLVLDVVSASLDPRIRLGREEMPARGWI